MATPRERPSAEPPFAFAIDDAGRLLALDPVFERLTGAAAGTELGAVREVLSELCGPVRVAVVDAAPLRAMLGAAPLARGWAVVGLTAEPGPGVTARTAFVAEVAARDPQAHALLGGMARRLAGSAGRSEELRRRSGFVVELAETIRLFSLNAILAAHRVRDAAAIGAVAALMKTRSDAAGPDILALAGEIEAAAERHEAATFQVALGRLQAEALPGAPWLGEALAVTLDAVADAIEALDAALDALAARSRAVEEHLKTLRFLELQGRIEAARSNDTEHVRALFEEIGGQVRRAGEELSVFSALATRRDPDVAREARRQAAALRS